MEVRDRGRACDATSMHEDNRGHQSSETGVRGVRWDNKSIRKRVRISHVKYPGPSSDSSQHC